MGAVAKTHRFDWWPRETLRPPVIHTYMMLSKFPHERTNKAILGVGFHLYVLKKWTTEKSSTSCRPNLWILTAIFLWLSSLLPKILSTTPMQLSATSVFVINWFRMHLCTTFKPCVHCTTQRVQRWRVNPWSWDKKTNQRWKQHFGIATVKPKGRLSLCKCKTVCVY